MFCVSKLAHAPEQHGWEYNTAAEAAWARLMQQLVCLGRRALQARDGPMALSVLLATWNRANFPLEIEVCIEATRLWLNDPGALLAA